MLNSLLFEMQHDSFQKKKCLELLTPGVKGVSEHKIFPSYHIAIRLVPFNLVCNITIFRKRSREMYFLSMR